MDPLVVLVFSLLVLAGSAIIRWVILTLLTLWGIEDKLAKILEQSKKD